MDRPRLIFVYRADSGLFNTLSDMAHKLFSPQTYECRLCELTHGVFTMHRQFRDFLSELDAEVEYLHRDQFKESFPEQDIELPAILLRRGSELEPLLGAEAIQSLTSLSDLESKLRAVIN
ncbi:MAG: hypothetical protein HUJ29_10640 [Gammaproteobacteria bacterium]|nr:hypothetical protein [Gammaproteobacteria bacterium]